MNMLDEYAKIAETKKEKINMSENTITDEFIKKLAKKVANVLMQSADENENENENENNENENNENENNENNENENDNENE